MPNNFFVNEERWSNARINNSFLDQSVNSAHSKFFLGPSLNKFLLPRSADSVGVRQELRRVFLRFQEDFWRNYEIIRTA
jgi:hypothetical protein